MIKIVKLFNDEDIIAEVEEQEGGLKLTNAIRIVLTQQGAAMIPMNPFIKDKFVVIRSEFIVYTGTPDEEVVNAYNQKFGTGIILPEPGMSQALKLKV